MTRLPVLHNRPRTLAECAFFGAPAAKSAGPTATAKPRAFSEVIELESDDVDEQTVEEDADVDELDEQLDEAAARKAEQLREEGGVPCPFVGCAEHLAWLAIGVVKPLELSESELLAALPRLEALDLDTLPATCAQRGPFTLEETGWFFGVTRERVRQMEAKALKRLRHPAHGHLFRGLRNEGHELSRPDLNDARTSIGLNAETITAAQRKFIPQMMVAADAARAHALHGLKHRAKGTSRCATKDCTNDRARYSRDVAAALLPLCGRCRATARKENGIPVRRHAPKLYTVRGESLSLEQWGARFECSAAAVTARAKYYKRSYEDEIEQRLVELDAKARAPVVEPPAAAPAPAPEPAAVAPVEPPSPPPAPVADPLTHAATVHEVFEHVVTNAKPEPAPEMIEIGDVKLTLRGWGYYLDLKRPELQRIQLLASKGGPSLVDELARLLAVKRAGRKPAIAKPSPAPIATTARVFEQVFASAPAPAPSEPTPALEPAAEQLTHDVDAPELEPETIAPPSIAPEAPVDASAPAAREDHVQTEPTITAAAPPKAVAAPRKRTHKPEPKHAPVRRVRSELDAIVRDAARGFSAIASRVGKGR